LEGVLGIDLLERSGRNVRTTAAGRVFASEARALLQKAERSIALARRARGDQEGTVRIAFVPPLPVEMSAVLNRSAAAVELRAIDWVSQVAVVREGRADLCIVRLPVDAADLETAVVWEEDRVAGFCSSHPMASQRSVSIMDLDNEPIVDYPSHRDYWSVNPRPTGRSPLWGPEVRTIEEMLEVVASGRAMCITGASVASFYHRSDVVFLPLEGVEASKVAVLWDPMLLDRTSEQVLTDFGALTR
ncbi:MAG: LysR substrate-binding domain-containing protein, partial [Acidimicrobiia bacterium]